MFQWLVSALLAVFPNTQPAPRAAAEPPMPPPAASFQELPCSGYDQIRSELGQNYAEEPVSVGLQSNGHLLQLFASPGSDTWTIVSLAPDGQACVVAAGADWRSLRPKAFPRSAPENGA